MQNWIYLNYNIFKVFIKKKKYFILMAKMNKIKF
jgi:hypothetical protein